ncbi:MAG: HIT domain-containing protein [Gammaproteobacteria bacterium]|nr:HIT domain-containing protein [Gammaproteobacteria bacterium]
MAELHPRLAADTVEIGRFPLCRVLLMKDANYPWCILVPDRADVTEIHQLSAGDQLQLMRESVRLSEAMTQVFRPDKLNIAALGNVVPQLHVHHIARYRHDPAWPVPVWGRVPAAEYRPGHLDGVIAGLCRVLGAETGFVPAADPG